MIPLISSLLVGRFLYPNPRRKSGAACSTPHWREGFGSLLNDDVRLTTAARDDDFTAILQPANGVHDLLLGTLNIAQPNRPHVLHVLFDQLGRPFGHVVENL